VHKLVQLASLLIGKLEQEVTMSAREGMPIGHMSSTAYLVKVLFLQYTTLEHLARLQVALLQLIQVKLPLGEESDDMDRVVRRSGGSKLCIRKT
jgi:hypothetical protein